MSNTTFKSITESILSDWKTGVQQLTALGAGLSSDLQSQASVITASVKAMSSLYTVIPGLSVDNKTGADHVLNETLNADDVDALINYSTNDEIVLSGYEQCFALRSEIRSSIKYFTIVLYDSLGNVLNSWETFAIHTLTKVVGVCDGAMSIATDKLANLYLIMQQAMQGRGLTQFFADACSFLANVFSSGAEVSSTLTSWMQSYNVVPMDVTTTLITNAMRGPTCVAQWIKQYVTDLRDNLTITSEDEVSLALPESKSLSYSTFSSGILLRSIGAVFTTVGIALVGVSRVASLIVSIIGATLEIASTIASNVVETLSGVSFNASSKGDHAFDFAVDKGTFQNSDLATKLRSFPANGCTCLHKPSATVWYFYLVQPNNLSSTIIGYEVHLSTDFDLSDWIIVQNGYTFLDGTTRSGATGIFAHPTTSQHLCITGAKSPDPSVVDSVLGTMTRLCFDARSMTVTNFKNGDNQFDQAFKPVDISMFDCFKDIFTSCMDLACAIRLASACMIFGWWICSPMIIALAEENFTSAFTGSKGVTVVAPRRNWTDASSDPSTWSVINTNDLQYGAICLFAYGFNALCMCFSSSSSGLVPQTEPSWHASKIEPLLKAVSLCFNGCISNATHSDVYNRNTSCFVFPTDETLAAYGGTYIHGITDQFYTKLDHLYNSINFVSYATDENFVNSWPQEWGVQLPTVTWTAYVNGLILDGVIALVIAAAAIGTTVAAVRIRNARAKLQAKVENAWYTYGEATGDPSVSQAQLDTYWKQYKSSRLSYNLLSLASGGTVMSLGLYDDGNSSASVIGKVAEWVKGTTQPANDEVSLKTISDQIGANEHSVDDIYHLIAGYPD